MTLLEENLANGLEHLGLALSQPTQQKLIAYITLLHKWNRVYNLTAIRQPQHMITHHLLDSLSALCWLPQERLRVLDVGSGGGMPGIPFAIARPQWTISLIDSNQKKTAFLRQAMIELGLSNITVHTQRVEEHTTSLAFDLITARAFSSLAQLVKNTSHLLASQGCYVAFKGASPAAEMTELPQSVKVTQNITLRVPGLRAARHLIIMHRQPTTLKDTA